MVGHRRRRVGGLGLVPTAAAAVGLAVGVGSAFGQGPAWWAIASGDDQVGMVGGQVSADGRVVSGYSRNPTNQTTPFTWTREGGRVDFGFVAGSREFVPAYGVSGDGSTVVGAFARRVGSRRREAYRARNGVIEGLGVIGPYEWSSGKFASTDGNVVSGVLEHSEFPVSQPFRWTPEGGMVALGQARPGDYFTSVEGMSRDGSVIAGRSSSFDSAVYYVWTAEGGMRVLREADGTNSNIQVYGVSGDGRTLLGRTYDTLDKMAIWRDGVVTVLGGYEGPQYDTTAYAMSDDGSVVVGQVWGVPERMIEAVVWTAGTGVISLYEYLVMQGVDFPRDWTFSDCRSISADGKTIVAQAEYVNRFGLLSSMVFVAHIPGPGVSALGVVGGIAAARRRRRA